MLITRDDKSPSTGHGTVTRRSKPSRGPREDFSEGRGGREHRRSRIDGNSSRAEGWDELPDMFWDQILG